MIAQRLLVNAAEALCAAKQAAIMREHDRVHRLGYRIRELLEKRIDLDHASNDNDDLPRNTAPDDERTRP